MGSISRFAILLQRLTGLVYIIESYPRICYHLLRPVLKHADKMCLLGIRLGHFKLFFWLKSHCELGGNSCWIFDDERFLSFFLLFLMPFLLYLISLIRDSCLFIYLIGKLGYCLCDYLKLPFISLNKYSFMKGDVLSLTKNLYNTHIHSSGR